MGWGGVKKIIYKILIFLPICNVLQSTQTKSSFYCGWNREVKKQKQPVTVEEADANSIIVD